MGWRGQVTPRDARDLGVGPRAAGGRILGRLEKQDRRTLPEHGAVGAAIERPAAFRTGVAPGQEPESGQLPVEDRAQLVDPAREDGPRPSRGDQANRPGDREVARHTPAG